MMRATRSIVAHGALAAALLAGRASAGTDQALPPVVQRVDQFDLGDRRVVVDFYHPSLTVEKAHPGFSQKPEAQQAELWDAHLHHSALYVFTATRPGTEPCAFVMRGDPKVTGTAFFYQLEAVKGGADLGNPNETNYAERVVMRKRLDEVHGSLFEHMLPEDQRAAHAGGGVKMYGFFVRIVPYAEIKANASSLMAEFFEKHR